MSGVPQKHILIFVGVIPKEGLVVRANCSFGMATFDFVIFNLHRLFCLVCVTPKEGLAGSHPPIPF